MRRAAPALLLILLSAARGAPSAELGVRATLTAKRLVECAFAPNPVNPWPQEDLWQSGNTMEALANLMLAYDNTTNPNYAGLLFGTFLRTPPVVDNCNDDHEWWLLAWVRAAQAVGASSANGTLYLERAAQIFDFIVSDGILPFEDICGGGVVWCPAPTGPYKNAITSELFLTAAMELHPYAAALGRPANYYLAWANSTWTWLQGSGMINAEWLVNDGLQAEGSGASCVNNKGTTWTYNQGVLLDGLAMLSNATGDASPATAAWAIANASMTLLSNANGILVEPCGASCDGDQLIFKGAYVRHLARFAVLYGARDPAAAASIRAFLQTNVRSMLSRSAIDNEVQPRKPWWGDYVVDWRSGPSSANPGNIATTSAALDLMTAAAITGGTPDTSAFADFGLGNCADAAGAGMPNCYLWTVSEAHCAAAALQLANNTGVRSAAYDYQFNCDGSLSCRVRSTAASAATCGVLWYPYSAVWQYAAGSATNVTTTTPSVSTICVRVTAA